MHDDPSAMQFALGRAFEEVAVWLRRSPRAADVSATGLSVLDRLTSSPYRVTELAALESISQPATTALLNRLEDSGWIAREPDPEDGRAQRIRITDAGAARLHRHREERTRRLAERLALLDASDQAALAAALPALTHLVAHDIRPRRDQDLTRA